MKQNEQSSETLGSAPLFTLMLKFAVPCVLSLLVSALYNVVDQIFIGNSELGDLGNAATGVVFPIFVTAQAFAWWLGDGVAAYMNLRQGAGDTQNVPRAIGTGITLSLVSSFVIMAVFYPLLRPALLMFGASQDSINYAVEYTIIILAFFPAFMGMNMITCIVRADGSPGWAMIAVLAGAVTNIALDALFIFVLRMGMAGAAWATGIGQTTSLGICLFYLVFRTKTFKLHARDLVPDLKSFGAPAKLGLSSLISQLTIVVIALTCNMMLKKYGGLSKYGENIPLAVIAVQTKVFTVVINLVVGIVIGCQPIISYNMGAKKYARVRRLFIYILSSTLAIGVISTLLFELAPSAVLGIFGEPNFSNPEYYWEFGEKTFRIFMMFIILSCLIKVMAIFFQAADKPYRALISSLVRDIACFLPLVIFLPMRMGIDGILWTAPIADAIAFVLCTALTVPFLIDLNRNIKHSREQAE